MPLTFRDWIAEAEPWAYGELQLKPWEFWRLTPREFTLMLDGVHRRYDRAWYRTAALGLWTLSPWAGKKHLSLDRLLGRRLKVWPDAAPHKD